MMIGIGGAAAAGDPGREKEGRRRRRTEREAIDERREHWRVRIREGIRDDQLLTFDFRQTDGRTDGLRDRRMNRQSAGGRDISAELRRRRGGLDWTLKCFPLGSLSSAMK